MKDGLDALASVTMEFSAGYKMKRLDRASKLKASSAVCRIANRKELILGTRVPLAELAARSERKCGLFAAIKYFEPRYQIPEAFRIVVRSRDLTTR
jgi:hypothetical protein